VPLSCLGCGGRGPIVLLSLAGPLGSLSPNVEMPADPPVSSRAIGKSSESSRSYLSDANSTCKAGSSAGFATAVAGGIVPTPLSKNLIRQLLLLTLCSPLPNVSGAAMESAQANAHQLG